MKERPLLSSRPMVDAIIESARADLRAVIRQRRERGVEATRSTQETMTAQLEAMETVASVVRQSTDPIAMADLLETLARELRAAAQTRSAA